MAIYMVRWTCNGLTHSRTVVGEHARVSLIARIKDIGAAYVVVPRDEQTT